MPEQVIRVLIVDDHPVFLRGLRAVLDEVPNIVVVDAVATGADAMRIALAAAVDVVLLDLNLPDSSGIEVTRYLTGQGFAGAILVLTMYDDDAALDAALTAGAVGYLLKGASQAEITAGIQTVSSGGMVFGAPVAVRVARRMAASPTQIADLTPREAEVLALIAGGSSNAQIARRLVVSDKTVRNHITNIFTKLGVTTRDAAIERARNAGLYTGGLPWEAHPERNQPPGG